MADAVFGGDIVSSNTPTVEDQTLNQAFGGELGDSTQAYIKDSTVTAAGAVTLNADTAASIDATGGAETTATAANEFAIAAKFGKKGSSVALCSPDVYSLRSTPIFLISSVKPKLPPTTPLEPRIDDGSQKISSPAQAIMYPPAAATSYTNTSTGSSFSCRSCRMPC